MPNEQIAVSHLQVDTINPRLRSGVADQPSAISAVVEADRSKFLDLAKHIAKNGLDPSNLPIAIPTEGSTGFYTIVEGNRRLTALKCLARPDLAKNALTTAELNRLTKYAGEYAARPLRKVECTVYPTREDAKPWVELKHLGTADGAAMQPWGPREKRNYEERVSGQKSPDMQVLDFAKDHGGLSAAQKARVEKKFNISTLARIVDYDAAASALGLEITDGVVRLRYSTKQAGKALGRVVSDIESGKLPVRKIYTNAQILDYVQKVVDEELPANAKQLNVAVDLPGAGEAKTGKASKVRKSAAKVAKASKSLISKTCQLHIALPKLESVYRELQRLPVDDYPNAVGVLFRVFFETTLEQFLLDEKLKTKAELDDFRFTLPQKAQAALNHLGQNSALSKDERRGLQRATSKDYYPESISTMHGFVHSKHFMASPGEVRSQWAGLQPFFEHVWRDVHTPAVPSPSGPAVKTPPKRRKGR